MGKMKTAEAKFVLQESGPVYMQVREQLKGRILKMVPGDKLPSERTLSEHFDIDRATLRRAMLDLAKEGFIVKQQGRGTFVGEGMGDTEVSGRPSQGTENKTISLIVPDVVIPYYAKVLKGVEQEAARHGYRIWVQNALLDAACERKLLGELCDEEVAGILTVPMFENSMNPDYVSVLRRLLAKGKNVVLLEQYVAGIDTRVVMVDKVKVGYLMTEHLIMSGHRRIAFVSTHTFDTAGNEAYMGYRQAFYDYGIKFDGRLVFDFPIQECAGPAHDAIVKLLGESSEACTAIATPQFSMTYGIYKALQELRLEQEIPVVGVDVSLNSEIAHLTHIEQPSTQTLGEQSVKLLLGIHDNLGGLQQHVLLAPRLVIGKK